MQTICSLLSPHGETRLIANCEPLTTNKMLSVTDLTGYMFCPRKLYLEKVLGLVEPDKAVMVKGSIVHKAMELFTKGEEGLVLGVKAPMTYLELLSIYQLKSSQVLGEVISQNAERLKAVSLNTEDIFLHALPVLAAESTDRAIRLHRALKAHEVFGPELWLSLRPKMHSELKIVSQKMELTGVIDRADFFDTHIIPVEIKTGKAPLRGAWPNHQTQLAAYALLLKEQYMLTVNSGLVNYTQAGESREIRLNAFHFEEVRELAAKVKALFASKHLPGFCKTGCFYCRSEARTVDEKLLAERMALIVNS